MKTLLGLSLLTLSSTTFAAEMISLYELYAPTKNADLLITTQGTKVANTKFAVNNQRLNIFQVCGTPLNVLQYSGFIKSGACGAYKAGSQLWSRAASLADATLPTLESVAVRVYPTGTTMATVVSTIANMELHIIGSLPIYTWQDCTQADTANYKLISTCTSGLALWKRTTPIQ